MTIVTLVIVRPLGGRQCNGGDGDSSNPRSRGKLGLLLSLVSNQKSHGRNLGGGHDSAEEEERGVAITRPPSLPDSAARSIHMAPGVRKTASNSPEAPTVFVGAPVQAGASQTLTSMGRWLNAAWGTLWRGTAKKRDSLKTASSATALPR